MEFVLVVWIVGKKDESRRLTASCIPVHAYGAFKGRPRVFRTVKPLFTLPRGSTLRSLRERVVFLKLARLHLGLGTAYYRAA